MTLDQEWERAHINDVGIRAEKSVYKKHKKKESPGDRELAARPLHSFWLFWMDQSIPSVTVAHVSCSPRLI